MARIDKVLHSWGPGEHRFALLSQGRLVELLVDRGGHCLGSVWLGRVVQVNRAINAAFVDIGDAQPGFLPSGKVGEGDAVMVQVVAEAQGGKGAKLTDQITLEGSIAVFTPRRPGLSVARKLPEDERDRLTDLLERLAMPGEGIVLLAEAAQAQEDELGPELAWLRKQWSAIEGRRSQAKAPTLLHRPDMLDQILARHGRIEKIVTDDPEAYADFTKRLPDIVHLHRDGPVFDLHDVEDEIERALAPVVKLPCGGALIIETARALTAIDVDSGGAKPVDANREAVAEVARQIRLRNLGGQVVVDFIPVGKTGNLKQPMEALRGKVKTDPVTTHVLGVGPLGLVEIMRERRRKPLADVMLAQGAAAPKSAETLALEALRMALREVPHLRGRPVLRAAPVVVDALQRLPQALAEAEGRLKQKLELRAEASLAPGDYQIVAG
ncbi:ribonuclease E/G [Telmatospirillum sp. J64-1]|uniref:ribonuclease E/G n=1 Tax=Telmatospirillum sp. J64-1 TaxID=2502183 RepID=UPI00115F5403|nr:ribonuclease E/G [Telmatospirillum sp. J64-1]